MVANTKMQRLVNAVDEYDELYPQYCETIFKFLDLAVEINAYIREHVGTAMNSKELRQLDEMCRDICIIQSRLIYIQFKLNLCVEATDRAKLFLRGKHSPEAMAQRIDECCACLIEWRDLKKDFELFFEATETKWHNVENQILQRFHESYGK